MLNLLPSDSGAILIRCVNVGSAVYAQDSLPFSLKPVMWDWILMECGIGFSFAKTATIWWACHQFDCYFVY